MLNHSVAGLYSRCNMNGTWSAIQGPESMGTTNAFSPAIDAEGNLHWISGLNEMKFQGVTLDDGLADVTHPVLAIDTDGGYHAMWQRSGTPYSIEYRYSSDAGKTWQPAERLSDPEGEFAEYPALAADGVGGIHLVWWENPRVWYRYWTKATGWGKPVELGRGVSSGIPVVTIDAKNRAHVVWQRDLNVYYVQQMQDGSWRPPRLLTVLKDHLGTGPRVVVDSRDVRHFVWADQGNDGARDIFYAALPPE
jgi:hypothetical protein